MCKARVGILASWDITNAVAEEDVSLVLVHQTHRIARIVAASGGRCQKIWYKEIEKFITRQPPMGEKDDYDSENSWISGELPSSKRL